MDWNYTLVSAAPQELESWNAWRLGSFGDFRTFRLPSLIAFQLINRCIY